jgi:hypothetical protein
VNLKKIEKKEQFEFELILPSFLKVSKSIEKRMWDFETPLRQHPYVKPDILTKLEARNFTIDKLRELDVKELGHMIHHGREFVDYFSSQSSQIYLSSVPQKKLSNFAKLQS